MKVHKLISVSVFLACAAGLKTCVQQCKPESSRSLSTNPCCSSQHLAASRHGLLPDRVALRKHIVSTSAKPNSPCESDHPLIANPFYFSSLYGMPLLEQLKSTQTLAVCAIFLVLFDASFVHNLPANAAVADTSSVSSSSIPWSDILQKASKKALGGGISGAAAGVAQVCGLMWLRTTMNFQYRYGTSTVEAMRSLYSQGGIARFYQGLPFALLQTPLSRFGDTAANVGVLALLASPELNGAGDLPIAVRTGIASCAGALWRIGLTPIDTFKTTLQVQGSEAYEQLLAKVKTEGPTVLFQGALASAGASFIGSYPWFLTYNALDELMPPSPEGDLSLKLARSAVAGICAAGVSDCVSNSIRVLKTTRQTAPTTITYVEAAQQVLDRDGLGGLFLRGLGTRLITNALQAILFSVVWKLAEAKLGY